MSHALQAVDQAKRVIGELVHNYRETELEHRNRRENGFDMEMPDVKTQMATDDRPTETQDLLSYLGSTFSPELSALIQADKQSSQMEM